MGPPLPLRWVQTDHSQRREQRVTLARQRYDAKGRASLDLGVGNELTGAKTFETIRPSIEGLIVAQAYQL
jgi:hypothetical protein